MAKFLYDDEKYHDSLALLTEVVFWDLTGCGNGFNYEIFLEITIQYLFPYEKLMMTIPPGIINEVIFCQHKLNYSDTQLRNEMVSIMSAYNSPIQFFTYEKCVDIFFWERDANTEPIKKIYAKAKKRFNPNSPNKPE